MPETPRTWTLVAADDPSELPAVEAGPILHEEEVRVYEAGPMDDERGRLLDLLAHLEALLSSSVELAEGNDCNVDAARDLLREYGRLGKEES